MFVIVCYDVNKDRVAQVMKICRKYLVHIQKSVFEGNLTEAKLQRLKKEIAAAIDTETDYICMYQMASPGLMDKEQIGKVPRRSPII